MYSEGRAEQFLSCCVASSSNATEEQTENKICKWVRDEKKQTRQSISASPNKATPLHPFRDGIWPGQSLYKPSNGKLIVITKRSTKTITPPAYKWPHPRGKRQLDDAGFWDQATHASHKRVLGSNRRKKSRTTPTKTLTPEQIHFLSPDPLEIVFQAYCPPIYLNINNIIGDALHEKRPVPNCRIVPYQKRRKRGFGLNILSEKGETIHIDTAGLHFSYAEQSRTFGSILFLMREHSHLLAKHILRLLNSPNANKQIKSREEDLSGRYFLIHNSQKQRRGKREVVGVVRQICKKRFVFVLVNDMYKTPCVQYCYLDSI